ncbi:MAG: DUF4330 domain-containing protein [Oscillospiraceae bacterium]|nr:DUF4330 domain-containing protein [Oscillospiraceae bacterium]
MDKNGKIFGKVSIIDIGFVLVIAAVIFGAYMRFSSGAGKLVTTPTKFEYVVKVSNVRQFTVDALIKKGYITDKKYEAVLGEIVDVKVEEAHMESVTAEGEVVDTALPERYTCYVTIRSDGKEGQNGYFNAKNDEISVGRNLNIYTKYVSTSGGIESIRILKQTS